MGGTEQNFINQAFKENWVAPLGPNVYGLESDIETYLGQNKYVSVLSSGTAAIHLGLILLNVKSGDEVLCQSFTFSASLRVFPSIICFGSSNKFIKVLIIEVSRALSRFKSFINNGSKIERRIANLEIVSSSRLRKLAWSIKLITVIIALEVWFAEMN